MKQVIGVAMLVSALGTFMTGCAGSGPNPNSPSIVSDSSDADTEAAARQGVALQGVVRGVSALRRAFGLVVRTDAGRERRLVRWDDRTEFWAGDRRVRPSVLADGMQVNVRGIATDQGILARRVEIVSRGSR